MNRTQLEHILRAAAGITGETEFVVIGSQAVLGQFESPPSELTDSMEAGVCSSRTSVAADLIDGSIGEGSPFHRTFGYHAHGVGLEAATLPDGWRARLVPLRSERTAGATGWCLWVHDLAISKLVAGREKVVAYLGAMLRHGLVDAGTLRARLADTPLADALRSAAAARLDRIIGTLRPA
ncbi:MAG: DUF6036 family nucleotidyltransferase [Planctomycetota bacterium]|nr:DUF6036 family nucleotidyltransferase [Planctomycetota bacterium]